MKRLCIIALALVLVFLFVWPLRGEWKITDTTLRVANATRQECSVGSATCIAWDAKRKEALVVTCHHLFQDGVGDVHMDFRDGQQGKGKILKQSRRDDLTLLVVPLEKEPPHVNLAVQTPQRGEIVWKVGYPYGRGPDWRRGVCLSCGREIYNRCYVTQGDSGGGFYNAKGELVGVISAYLNRDHENSTGAGLDAIKSLTQSCWPICPNGLCPNGGFPFPDLHRAEPSVPSLPQSGGSGALRPLPVLPPIRGSEAHPSGPSVQAGPLSPLSEPAASQAILESIRRLEARLDGIKPIPGPMGPQGVASEARIQKLEKEVEGLHQTLGKLKGSIRVKVDPVPSK